MLQQIYNLAYHLTKLIKFQLHIATHLKTLSTILNEPKLNAAKSPQFQPNQQPIVLITPRHQEPNLGSSIHTGSNLAFFNHTRTR